MAVPMHYEFYPSVIRCLGRGDTFSAKEIAEFCADDRQLTDADKMETTPSGVSLLRTRANWACVYLRKAGLIERPKRGYYALTDEGRTALNLGPEQVTKDYLMQFESFRLFVNGSADTSSETPSPTVQIESETSPEDRMKQADEEMKALLAEELLEEIMKLEPGVFERLVVRLLVNMGFGELQDSTVTPYSGDGGIDGIVNGDKLGLEAVYVQAKHWDSSRSVGSPEIAGFIGALDMTKATKGVFITTSSFTSGAREAAKKATIRIALIDGKRLTELMIDYNIGVSVQDTYYVKRIDTDFFDEL